MKVGFVGLGKMGLPIAVAMALKGHDVMGYDVDASKMTKDPKGYREAGPFGAVNFNFNHYLADSAIRFGPLADVVEHGDVVFVAVQTPHDDKYEGVTRVPDERADFDYAFLRLALSNINEVARNPVVVSVMSTVLPGTVRRELMLIVDGNSNVSLAYNPSFIAMGTTMRDFLSPEFVLVGVDDEATATVLRRFYEETCSVFVMGMSIESAELAKVAYNTCIALKITFANTVMEICERVDGADCDDVTNVLKIAKKRIVSPTYMTGGMGDGGGCHPRDNIAMSWFANGLGLSFNVFDAVMSCREKQAEWLARMMLAEQAGTKLPLVILGTAFKPETDLVVGSPALLVGNILEELGANVLYVDDFAGTPTKESEAIRSAGVFLIGCRHIRYASLRFASGSVIIDPHRYVSSDEADSYKVLRLGESDTRRNS